MGDSWRYIPENFTYFAGSTLPKFVNSLIPLRFGDYGIAVMGSILVSYSSARLFTFLFPEIKKLKAALLVFVLSFISFTAFYSIMVSTEPHSISYLILVFVVAVSRKTNPIDILVMLLTAASHHSNMLVVGMFIFIYLIKERDTFFTNLKFISLSILLPLIISLQVESFIFKQTSVDQQRLNAGWLGTVILTYYPEAYYYTCTKDPDFPLCADEYFNLIEKHTKPKSFLRVKYIFLESSLVTAFHRRPEQSWPPIITPEELDRLSWTLIKNLVYSTPDFYSEYLRMTVQRWVALMISIPDFSIPPSFNINKFYDSRSVEDLEKYQNSKLVVDEMRKYGIRHIAALLKFLQILLIYALIMKLLFHYKDVRLPKFVFHGLVLYFSNILILGFFSGATPRYHDRVFFIITYLLIYLAIHYKSLQVVSRKQ